MDKDMSRERVVIFANPIAGRGKGRLLAERLIARFEQEGGESVAVFERPDEVAEEALAGTTAGVAVGGDGGLAAGGGRGGEGGEGRGPGGRAGHLRAAQHIR